LNDAIPELVQYVLVKDSIRHEAMDELRQRILQAKLTPERFYNLILTVTEDPELADRQRALYELELMKLESRYKEGLP
jgi:rRNA pseudouridine-1189 N-methylase Emg1 (Nep1/Mra1 family)